MNVFGYSFKNVVLYMFVGLVLLISGIVMLFLGVMAIWELTTDHIGSARREETRQQRLEQSVPMILEGIGRNDKYIKK